MRDAVLSGQLMFVRHDTITACHGRRDQYALWLHNAVQRAEQCTYNVALRRVRVTILAVEKALSITYFV
jgi:hypothetical protein